MGNDRTATVAVRGLARLLAASMLCTLAACGSHSAEDAQSATTPGNVTLTQAQRQHITLYTVAVSDYHRGIDTTGVVDFDQNHTTQILAPFSGPVQKLLVAQGDEVKQGQPLAIVISPDFADVVATWRKTVVAAANARRIADHDADMLAHHALSQRETEQAQTDAASAEADRASAWQALAAMGIDPRSQAKLRAGQDATQVEGVIRAPIAGTVVERNITPGQLLQAGSTPCFTIANIASVWVDANVFGADAAQMRAGDTAQIRYDDGAPALPGTVTAVSAEVDPDTRATTARVAVANPGGVLKKQMYVDVHIESQQVHRGLLAPVAAVLRDDDNLPFVYVVQHDGSYARAHVTLGERVGDRYLIPSGLRAGERIVSDGALFLRFIQSQ